MPRRRKECVEGGRVREKPVQRNAANARERARMRILSRAFSRLKTTLPWVPADTKLSKLDTLRLATSYIAHLRALLQDEGEVRTQTHPLSLTWPFSFPRSSGSGSGGHDHCDGYTHYDPTPNHAHPQPAVDRYFSDDLPDYDYYPPELLHIA
ncbi:transcription factor 21-like [Panulirus ornatus]|uniref:transcription factor 21-like n=1 Tax=Panulirus ornatus TaxID=150431 RepID=UPI003A8BC3D1